MPLKKKEQHLTSNLANPEPIPLEDNNELVD